MSRFLEEATLVVGHRGGRGEGWPAENSLAAFERAAREGARAVELDVRTTKDGQVVVFHDETLGRMTGGTDPRRLADVTLEELGRVRIHGERVPTLREVLAWAAASDVSVNVELKHEVPSRLRLARKVGQELARSEADVAVSSFEPVLLSMIALFAPRRPRAFLTHARESYGDVAHAMARPALVSALHLERTETAPSSVARFVDRGLRVGVWTVNDPEEARDLVALGVRTIITDRPGELLSALGAR